MKLVLIKKHILVILNNIKNQPDQKNTNNNNNYKDNNNIKKN